MNVEVTAETTESRIDVVMVWSLGRIVKMHGRKLSGRTGGLLLQ